MGTFIVFFNQSLGLSLEQIGHMNAVNGVMIAVCLLFAGSLVDRWHPVRIIMYSSIWAGLTAFNNLIWLAAIPPESRVMLWILLGGLCAAAPYSAVVQAAGVPREMILLPKEQYGQFSGAQGVVRAVGTMTGGALAGLFLDMVKRFYEKDSLFPYRYIYIWIGFFTCVGALYNYRVYRSWKRLGAEDGYRPPLKRFRFKDLPPATEVRPAPKGPLWLFAFLFLGVFLSNAFLVWYFKFVMPDSTNVILFSAMVAVSCVEFWLFLRLVRFVERP